MPAPREIGALFRFESGGLLAIGVVFGDSRTGGFAKGGGQVLPTGGFSYKLRGKENVCKPCP